MTNGNATTSADATPKTEAEKQSDFRYKAAVFTQALQKVIFKRVSEVEDPNEKMRLLNGQAAVSKEVLRLIG